MNVTSLVGYGTVLKGEYENNKELQYNFYAWGKEYFKSVLNCTLYICMFTLKAYGIIKLPITYNLLEGRGNMKALRSKKKKKPTKAFIN